jgi:hypothetical protein
MIKFKNEKLGDITIKFRHHLPFVDIPNLNNSLKSIVTGIKLQKGYTECFLNLGVDENRVPLWEFYGYSITHPNDHYRKETGRTLSLQRAVESMIHLGHFTDADGRAIMVGYYSR